MQLLSLSSQYSPFLHSFMFPYFSKSLRYRTQVNNGSYVTIVVTRQFTIVDTGRHNGRPLCYPDTLPLGDYITKWHGGRTPPSPSDTVVPVSLAVVLSRGNALPSAWTVTSSVTSTTLLVDSVQCFLFPARTNVS